MHVHTDTRASEILDAEDALAAYCDAHYGPLWGHANEAESERLRTHLRDLYNRHSIPADERMAGVD